MTHVCSSKGFRGTLSSLLLSQVLFFLLGAISAFQLQPTTLECTGKDAIERVCKFHNLVLHGPDIYWITEGGETPSVPKIPMTWVAPEDQHDLDKQLKYASMSDLPFNLAHAEVETAKDAILWHRGGLLMNLAHMMGEMTPTIHGLICQHLGYCRFAEHKAENDIQVVFIDEGLTNDLGETTRTVSQTWGCLSQKPWIERMEPQRANKVLVMQTALAGLGPTCRAFGWCSNPDVQRKPMPQALMHSFRDRMCDCMDVNPDAPVQAAIPRVKILQRGFAVHRSFLNLVDVEEQLKKLQQDLPFNFHILHNEGLTLKEQAHEFASADILVGMHGAALTMMMYMPVHSVLIEVMPFNWNGNHEFYEPLVAALEPMSKLQVRGLDTLTHQQTHLFVDNFKGDPAYIEMSSDEKLALLEQGICPERPGHPCGMWWMHESAAALDVFALEALLKSSIAEMGQLQHMQEGHGRRNKVLEGSPAALRHAHSRRRLLY
ncbi:hypothetical protein WJX74_001394 [Apatococcus lobatus]|uniref:EGF domain-specific O-linked N-acetylglucosamine transferase n=1 Tax=Apatococcus lobatus TaxID=904363 RepID=A0AAW1QVC6_9CHLO